MGTNFHPAVAAAQGQPERLLRPDQVARLLGVTPHQVRKLWRQGKLGGEKSSARNLKIPESAVREYLNALNQE
jgi:excisionase family DNA binding protein